RCVNQGRDNRAPLNVAHGATARRSNDARASRVSRAARAPSASLVKRPRACGFPIRSSTSMARRARSTSADCSVASSPPPYADVPALEEAHLGRGRKEVAQAERVTVESNRPILDQELTLRCVNSWVTSSNPFRTPRFLYEKMSRAERVPRGRGLIFR